MARGLLGHCRLLAGGAALGLALLAHHFGLLRHLLTLLILLLHQALAFGASLGLLQLALLINLRGLLRLCLLLHLPALFARPPLSEVFREPGFGALR